MKKKKYGGEGEKEASKKGLERERGGGKKEKGREEEALKKGYRIRRGMRRRRKGLDGEEEGRD